MQHLNTKYGVLHDEFKIGDGRHPSIGGAETEIKPEGFSMSGGHLQAGCSRQALLSIVRSRDGLQAVSRRWSPAHWCGQRLVHA